MDSINNKQDKLALQADLGDLDAALALARHTVCKQYLNELSTYPLVEPGRLLLDETPQRCVRMFQLTQLTCKKGEDIFQKLSTVYHAAASLGCSLFVMVDVAEAGAPAEICLGVRSPGGRQQPLSTSYYALRDGLTSNFPGSQVREISASQELEAKLDGIFGKEVDHIASVSCVASVRDKSRTENKSFVQGLEKLIDAMRGTPYTAIFIADPVSPRQQSEIRGGYESLYSTLSAFRRSTWSYGESESRAVMESLSQGISRSVTEGTSRTQSHTVARTVGSSDTVGGGASLGASRGTSGTHTRSKPTAASRVGGLLRGAGGVLAALSAVAPAAAAVGAVAGGVGGLLAGGSESAGIARSLGLSGGLSANYSHGAVRNRTASESRADTRMESVAETRSETRVRGTTETAGASRTLQIENVNKSVEELLERIGEQLRRVREGEDYGAYSCGAYFLSGRQDSSLLAANTYRALMLGEGSAVESGAVNSWQCPEIVDRMKEYLRRFAQPVFVRPMAEGDEVWMLYSPGTVVSGLELPLHLGLPTRSVVGLPVTGHAEFGRNAAAADPAIPLGRLYHMGRAEEVQVRLGVRSLAAHAFLAGSTGAGKSNAVCRMLEELGRKNVKFLVVEPAKGEYKRMLGGRADVAVYGTNGKLSQLLRLDPFSFPEEVHVLEHIDRLVEIFNACWPMYAAMPAVLKDAIEEAYRGRGWDLAESYSAYGQFPTFADLCGELPRVLERSDYSADTKGDYIGALVTRVRSLTNGINGQIFCSGEELTGEELFDRNAVVDISRVGSPETKALLMGILVMKLQEHRMAGGRMNAELEHVTVLEEAHRLLRRTGQIQEGAGLQGKSVEMLADAIAEMRTYGEGFLIADQAPGLLDPSVIRNTNTKIILRLPDESDRLLVGRAASLNDDQIVELARLPLGVAAVYQSDWPEPVLCQFGKFEPGGEYVFRPAPPADCMTRFFRRAFCGAGELSPEEEEQVRRWIEGLREPRQTKDLLRGCIREGALSGEERRKLAYDLFEGKRLLGLLEEAADDGEGIRRMDAQIEHRNGLGDRALAERVRRLILQAVFFMGAAPGLYERFHAYAMEGGKWE